MSTALHEIDERTNLTANNKFELLLFRLGEAPGTDHRELFGINVFKIREILVMPTITAVANAPEYVMGVANIRGQIITVIDLPRVVGCTPKKGTSILLVTEYARSTQAFAVEEVNEIARLDWNQVIAAEGKGGNLITSIARLDGDKEDSRLAQVLDVEQILRDVLPSSSGDLIPEKLNTALVVPAGKVILAADDSPLARSMIENSLKVLNVPFEMTKTGLEAWTKIQSMADAAEAEGKTIQDKVALVLTDLEMPEMDGFTLTRNIKNDQRFKSIPVVIHSSLTGEANENHVKSVGADAYVAKFVAEELAEAMRNVMNKTHV
ncbi:chemotaxis protein [Nitrosomonas sp.]|uniref:chemotaxis protein n=1 Tax=Nitrosomonas sp. TaxID=42353 RepID=UPI001D3DD382|nr:chemotaxis protein [Nitrosomonas sp.]MBX3616399.1 chemotaxis protein CheV [Nitrosomonas sp.]